MKKFKYVFLILGIINLLDAGYTFIEPDDSYKILSFEVPHFAYVIYKVIFGISFIFFFKKEWEKK